MSARAWFAQTSDASLLERLLAHAAAIIAEKRAHVNCALGYTLSAGALSRRACEPASSQIGVVVHFCSDAILQTLRFRRAGLFLQCCSRIVDSFPAQLVLSVRALAGS